MTGPVRSAVLTAVAIVLCFAGWWLLFVRNETLRQMLAAERQRARLLVDVEQLEGRLVQAVEHLPADTRDPHWFRPLIAGALRAAKLAASDWSEAALGERLGEWELHRVTFTLTGRFPDVASFLAWLERATPRVRLERLLLERSTRDDVKATVRLLVPAPARGA